MSNMRYLSFPELLGIHALLLQESGPPSTLLDDRELENVSLRPLNLAYQDGADLIVQAAELVRGIAAVRTLGNWNKRLALVVGETFLRRNGVIIEAPPLAFAQQIVRLIDHSDDRDNAMTEFIAWLRAYTIRS